MHIANYARWPPKKCARKCSYSQIPLQSRAVTAASQIVYICFGEKKEHLLVYKNVAVLHASIAIGTASARSWAGLMLMQFDRKASVCCNQTKTVPKFYFVPLPSLVCSPEDSTGGFVMWLVPYLVWLLPHHLYSIGATRIECSNLEGIYIFGCRQTHSWFGSTNQLGCVLCIGMIVQGR